MAFQGLSTRGGTPDVLKGWAFAYGNPVTQFCSDVVGLHELRAACMYPSRCVCEVESCNRYTESHEPGADMDTSPQRLSTQNRAIDTLEIS
jgi:hypothetical protein